MPKRTAVSDSEDGTLLAGSERSQASDPMLTPASHLRHHGKWATARLLENVGNPLMHALQLTRSLACNIASGPDAEWRFLLLCFPEKIGRVPLGQTWNWQVNSSRLVPKWT